MRGSRRFALGRRNGLRPSSLGGAVIALLSLFNPGESGIHPGMLERLIGMSVLIGLGVGNALASYASGSWLYRQRLG